MPAVNLGSGRVGFDPPLRAGPSGPIVALAPLDLTGIANLQSDFGARPIVGIDNSKAIQAAFDYSASTGLPVYIPPGTFQFASELFATRWAGSVLFGAGYSGASGVQSRLQWSGAAGAARAIHFVNCRDSQIFDFNLDCRTNGPINAIECTGDSTDPHYIFPTSMRWGLSVYGAGRGLLYTYVGLNQGNDFATIEYCEFLQQTLANVSWGTGVAGDSGSNMKANIIRHCKLENGPSGAVWFGGAGNIVDTFFAGHSGRDIGVGSTNQSVDEVWICACQSEGANRFFEENFDTLAASSLGYPLNIISNRVSTDSVAADRATIFLRRPGPAIIRSNVLGEFNQQPAKIKIDIAGSGLTGQYTAEYNVLKGTPLVGPGNSSADFPLVEALGTCRVFLWENQYYRNTSIVTKPEETRGNDVFLAPSASALLYQAQARARNILGNASSFDYTHWVWIQPTTPIAGQFTVALTGLGTAANGINTAATDGCYVFTDGGGGLGTAHAYQGAGPKVNTFNAFYFEGHITLGALSALFDFSIGFKHPTAAIAPEILIGQVSANSTTNFSVEIENTDFGTSTIALDANAKHFVQVWWQRSTGILSFAVDHETPITIVAASLNGSAKIGNMLPAIWFSSQVGSPVIASIMFDGFWCWF